MIYLIFAVIWGFICLGMADKRHRNPGLGFIGGLLFGIFAVIYYLMAGNKK